MQANFSFSGSFSPLSKLIVCAVMIRGRHRGLPVAIDRAIMLPFEYTKQEEEERKDNDMPGLKPSKTRSKNDVREDASGGGPGSGILNGYTQEKRPPSERRRTRASSILNSTAM